MLNSRVFSSTDPAATSTTDAQEPDALRQELKPCELWTIDDARRFAEEWSAPGRWEECWGLAISAHEAWAQGDRRIHDVFVRALAERTVPYHCARRWLRHHRPDLILPAVEFNIYMPSQAELRDFADRTAKVHAELKHWDESLDDRKSRPAGETSGAGDVGDSASGAMARLLSLYTSGVTDDRFRRAVDAVNDVTLTVNEKLVRLNRALTLPATASAEGLAKLLGVSKTAVIKTVWWKENRRGEKASEVGRRRRRHQQRAGESEPADRDDDDG
jgi:hypothetical protein